jgi:acyl-coenzyme A synthetase/AMP-(fatty) acid ligase
MSQNLASLILTNEGIALIDANSGLSFSYKDLRREVNCYEEVLYRKPGIYAVICKNKFQNIAFYVACLKTKSPVLLLPSSIAKEAIEKLTEAFQLSGVFGIGEEGLNLFASEPNYLNYPTSTAILIGTSGSQSHPKFVRISMQNLIKNSFAIIESLEQWEKQKNIATLPWHYSYGLSILNTHLVTGNTVILNQHPILSEKFWKTINKYKVTNFGGVPSQYETLYRLRERFISAESIEYVTQAGGKLSSALRTEFHHLTTKLERKLYIMYGQTEATARISILSPEQFEFHEESVGRCIGDGIMTESNGQLMFKGSNVCLGYASSAEDLFHGDVNLGILHTGDKGYVDSDGFIYVIGRSGRDIKISGVRISLDIIESQLESAEIKAYALGLKTKVGIVHQNFADREKILGVLQNDFNLSKRDIVFRQIENIPLLENGKVDFRLLQEYF